MGISYLATGEWFGAEPKYEHKFFSSTRAKTESPKAIKEADDWIASKLREHGTDNCRVTLSKVIFCITG